MPVLKRERPVITGKDAENFLRREKENERKLKARAIEFELRGDDREIIHEITQYIPIEREDIWSYLIYLENCIIKVKRA